MDVFAIEIIEYNIIHNKKKKKSQNHEYGCIGIVFFTYLNGLNCLMYVFWIRLLDSY